VTGVATGAAPGAPTGAPTGAVAAAPTAATARSSRGELAILVLGALAVQTAFAVRWELGFDETLHVFQATVRPLDQFWSELRTEAHPPLLHVLLRLLCWPSDSSLLPRLPCVLAGAASTWLAHRVARGMCRR
jgi:hypothetical protein